MKRHGFIAHIGVLIAVLVGMMPTILTASAQDGGSQQVATGQTVTWTSDWTLDPELSTTGAVADQLVLGRDDALVGVGGTSYIASVSELRDSAIETFDWKGTLRTLDRGEYGNVSYSLDVSTAEPAGPIAIFTLIKEHAISTSVAVLIAPVADFGAAMEAAQAGLQINNVQLFVGVDGPGMQQYIEDTIGTADPLDGLSTPTQATQEVPTEAATEDVETQPGQVVPTPAPTQPAEVAATDVPAESTPTTDDGEGLVGDLDAGLGEATPVPDVATPVVEEGAALTNTHVIPSNGVELAYSADWEVENESDTSVQLGSVVSPVMFLNVLDMGSYSSTPDAMSIATAVLDDPSLEGAEIVEAIDVDENRKVFVLVEPDPNSDVYLIYDITLSTESTIGQVVTISEEELEAGIDLVSSTVELNGQPVFADFREIVPSLFVAGGN